MSLILLCFISNFAINTEFKFVKAYFSKYETGLDYSTYYQPSYEELQEKGFLPFLKD